LKEGYMFIPLIAIIYFLVGGMSPAKAGFYAIVILVILSLFNKKTRLNFKKIIDALEQGATSMITIAVACGTAGIIAGLISLTGLGIKLSYFVKFASGDILFIALILTMIITIILGMGMPVTAAYILVSATTATILTRMGVSTLATHMFIFYF